MTAAGRAFRWWQGEMSALVPVRLRRALSPEPPVVFARPGAGSGAPRLSGAGVDGALDVVADPELRRLARARRSGRARMVLVVPHALAVRRRIVLPPAARQDAGRVIRYELDRLTPFSPSELYYAHRPLDDQAGAFELIFARRADLAPTVDALAPLGLGPDAIDAAEPNGTPMGLDLLRGEGRPARTGARRLTGALAAALAVILAGWGWVETGARAERAEALRAEITELRRAVLAADPGPGDAAADPALAALELRERRTRALDVLDRVTRLLPEDTYLERFSVDGSDVEIGGVTEGSAARLIGLIDADPALAAPAFAAPVRMEEKTERFTLRFRATGEVAE